MSRTIGAVTVTTSTAAAITTIIVWIGTLLGLDIPSEVQGALTTIIVFIAGWAVPGTANNVETIENDDSHAGQ